MSNKFCGLFRRQHLTSELTFDRAYSPTEGRLAVFGVQRQNCKMKMKITPPPPRSVARGVGGAGGPGTAKVFFNEKIDCSLVSEIPRGPHWLSTALPPHIHTPSRYAPGDGRQQLGLAIFQKTGQAGRILLNHHNKYSASQIVKLASFRRRGRPLNSTLRRQVDSYLRRRRSCDLGPTSCAFCTCDDLQLKIVKFFLRMALAYSQRLHYSIVYGIAVFLVVAAGEYYR